MTSARPARALLALCLVASASARAGGGGGSPSDGIDDGLYSRQLYTIGRDAQARVSESRVLIAGLRATGVELAKNLILAGVQSVFLHDATPVDPTDLAGNYCLDESHVGRERAECVRTELAALNPEHVDVSVRKGELTADALRACGAKVLVAADLTHAEQLALNDACRAAGVRFVSASACGLFGRIFCDFGDSFVVEDADGEAAREAHIERIDPDGTVTCADASGPHGLSRDDLVAFEAIEGLEGACTPGVTFRVARVRGAHKFVVSADALREAAGDGAAYVRGGRARRVKTSATLAFEPLRAAAAAPLPRHVPTDDSKEGEARRRTVHAAFCALAAGSGEAGAQGFDEFEAAARAAAAGAELDPALLRAFWAQARACVRPMAALLGGLGAAEALKAATHKWTPVCQFLYYDAAECLPGWPAFDAADAPADAADGRFCGQALALGRAASERLAAMRVFVVGAGAIGCELLKNFAGMGVGLREAGGCVQLTDMDMIERSNLNRQLLFRAADIGGMKSECAARACKRLCPQMRVRATTQRLAPETTNGPGAPFGEAFWAELDLVATALDNVQARLHADELSVTHAVPLIDSGTLGAKGSVQPAVPHLTESYGASADPPDSGDIPFCTLKAFPYAVEHCVAWARELFDGEFGGPIGEAKRFVTDEGAFVRQFVDGSAGGVDTQALGDALKRVVAALEAAPATYAQCVARAAALFGARFDRAIHALLRQYPAEHVDEDGQPFWRGAKRRPRALALDAADEEHLEFVRAAARLYAEAYGIEVPAGLDAAGLRAALAKELAAGDGAAAAAAAAAEREAVQAAAAGGGGAPGDDDEPESAEDMQRMLAEAEALLARADELREAAAASGRALTPLEFEKDDDSNGHLDFIVAASNLRADNYDIARTDRHESRRVAGRIVPAIATTTSVVSALVCLELYKLALLPPGGSAALASGSRAHKDALRRRFKSAFVNLALPLVASSEPVAPAPRELGGALDGLTEWDKLHVDGARGQSIGDLAHEIAQRLGGEVDVLALTCGEVVLFSSVLPCPFEPDETIAAAVGRSDGALRPASVGDGQSQLRLGVTAVERATGATVNAPPILYRWPGD